MAGGQQGLEAADLVTSVVRKLRETMLLFSLLQPGTHPMVEQPIFRTGLPASVEFFWKTSSQTQPPMRVSV